MGVGSAVQDLVVEVVGDITDLKIKAGEAETLLHELGGAGEHAGSTAAGGISKIGVAASAAGVALVAVIGKAIELSIEADKQFRAIAASLPTFTEGIGELQEQLDAVAVKSGGTSRTCATSRRRSRSSASRVRRTWRSRRRPRSDCPMRLA